MTFFSFLQLDTKGRSILMEQVLERSVQVTENVEVKYKVDQASDTWVGPLPCCWHLLPQAYLVSHPLYKTLVPFEVLTTI